MSRCERTLCIASLSDMCHLHAVLWHACNWPNKRRCDNTAARLSGSIFVQITGGHKYLPPRQDVNAPDLYIPFMAACTFCLLASVSRTLSGRFTPETMYATVSCPCRTTLIQGSFDH